MRLKQVDNERGVYFTCVTCNMQVFPKHPVYADLDGVPFKDYYCGKCAAVLRALGRANEE